MCDIQNNDCLGVAGRRYRCLQVAEDCIYVIDLDERFALPSKWSRSYVDELFDAGRLVPLQREARFMAPGACRPSKLRVRDIRYRHVHALTRTPGILDRAERVRLVRHYSIQSGVSIQTLMQLLRAWWQGGQTVAVLNPTHKTCGPEQGLRLDGDE